MTCPVTERSLATVACCYTNIFTSSDTIKHMRNIFLTLTAIFFAAKADAKAGSSEISLSTDFSYFSTPHIRVIRSLQLRPVHMVFVAVFGMIFTSPEYVSGLTFGLAIEQCRPQTQIKNTPACPPRRCSPFQLRNA